MVFRVSQRTVGREFKGLTRVFQIIQVALPASKTLQLLNTTSAFYFEEMK